MAAPRVLLVDASPYIFRAHFALPSSMVDRQGRPVNAVYGFASFLLKLMAEEGPSHVGIAFDRSLTTSFRNELYPDYKGQRELPPPDLEDQLDDCLLLTEAMGTAAFVDERYEADDLVATLCARIAPTAATVVTSDKDLAQLVDERVDWLDFARGERYDAAEVEVRLGIEPARIPDLLGLAGDSVDNIPGVRGIGPKTALALLAHFPSVEAVCEGVEEIATLPLRGAARLAKLVGDQAEQAILSKELATVVRSAPVHARLADLELSRPDTSRLDPLCERLGFEALRQRILERH